MNAKAAAPIEAIVIEDDNFVRGVMGHQLWALGATNVLSASDWAAARALLEQYPSCNVAISDLDFPGAEGSRFLDELSELRPGIALVLVSSLDPVVMKAAEKRARKLPLRLLGSIAKPVSVDALRSLLAPFGAALT